ncbi:hypothetical protein M422DRAFT_273877 [Sphaerobolus stellatus SS14]|uniref:Unplaced genomic scaffold SPHSTscaffold_354, whole genome shotgun sequence n=1 Tax=Sphaerobolus stellatus (strain SS14) TaxID=990650 RepID=A0A0C9TTG5_SPHS4|nr:hypothetical protein M422DRAFT_273877 [Sphaerobolus stellatus SS14]
MSNVASSSKSVTANSVLYKRSSDMPHFPIVLLSDTHRTLKGFKAVPDFKGHKDPMKTNFWPNNDEEECWSMVAGYWRAYDMESIELRELFTRLKKEEEAEAEKKWRAEEDKRRKMVLTTLGSEKGKDVSQVIDSGSEDEIEGEFRETCLNCPKNQVTCVFTHPSNSKKKTACDRCVCRNVNCTYWSPYKVIMERTMKGMGKNLLWLETEADDLNRINAEGMYHKYNLMIMDSL